MKRLHLVMLLVVMIFAGIFLGNLFGGRRGALAGGAAGVVLAGAFLWTVAPRELRRHLAILDRNGIDVGDVETFRARYLRGARVPAVVLIALGLAGIAVLLFVRL
jgi:hypothetical protein